MKKLVLVFSCVLAFAGLASTEREAMSPFDDAAYWFRGGVDSNGNGLLDTGTYEFRDVTHASNASHANHKMTLAQSNAANFDMLVAGQGKVVMPYAGRVLSDAPYLHLPQRFVTNGVLEVEKVTTNITTEADVTVTNIVVTTNSYPYGTLRANFINLPNILDNVGYQGDCTNYTVFVRFRDHSRVSERQGEHNLFQMGFQWLSGGGTGVSLNLVHNSGYLLPKPYYGSNQQPFEDSSANNNFKIRYGQWCDLAMSVQGRKVLFAMCQSRSESPLTNMVFDIKLQTVGNAYNPAITTVKRSVMRIGGEDSGTSGVFTNGLAYTNNGKAGGTHEDGALNNKVKCLRGDIHSFAFWTRALTTNEIRQVFSVRRPTIMQLGLANGSSDEFAKESDTVDATGLHPETWNPVLNAQHPTSTINFAVVDGEQGVSQYIRLRPLAGSAQATIAFALDGTPLATQTVLDDRDALVYVKAAQMTKGNHVLTLTRTDARGGDFTVDALKIGGSWRIGDTSDSYGGMVHESNHPYQYTGTPRVFPLTDGNMDHFARGLSGGPSSGNGKHVIPFDMPADLLKKTHDPKLIIDFNGGTMTFNVYINGVLLAENLSNSAKQTIPVPMSMLHAGENTVMLHQQSGSWGNIKMYCLNLGKPVSGCIMILR